MIINTLDNKVCGITGIHSFVYYPGAFNSNSEMVRRRNKRDVVSNLNISTISFCNREYSQVELPVFLNTSPLFIEPLRFIVTGGDQWN